MNKKMSHQLAAAAISNTLCAFFQRSPLVHHEQNGHYITHLPLADSASSTSGFVGRMVWHRCGEPYSDTHCIKGSTWELCKPKSRLLLEQFTARFRKPTQSWVWLPDMTPPEGSAMSLHWFWHKLSKASLVALGQWGWLQLQDWEQGSGGCWHAQP